MIKASTNGHKAVCELLLARGCNVDMQSKDGSTALMCASQNGHKVVCELLITGGCNVDMQTNNGWTALIWASQNGHEAVCELLITHRCNVDMQNKDGRTALMNASRYGKIPVVISLIEAGCDYSLRNKDGKSAMDILREKHPDEVEEVQVSRSPTAVVTHSLIWNRNELEFQTSDFLLLSDPFSHNHFRVTHKPMFTGGYRCDE